MDSKNIKNLVIKSYNSDQNYRELESGLPENYKDIKTLGDLLECNYKFKSVEKQLRENLIRYIREDKNPYHGIIGYDDDIIPSINRAILSGHDMIFFGQIGQAKTKVAETIARTLLSPIPVVRGTITNDIPTSIPQNQIISLLLDEEVSRSNPVFVVSKDCEEIIRDNKLDTKIDWVEGKDRYRYILATPDISVKDLVGQIDAIRIAKKGVEIYDIDSYSPGQLLQARHGILCIDELPVLDPRKQVTLLSVLQEGKFTTGTYPVYFEPDVKIIATANPIDYTHSGKIIEPLLDRLRSHIKTHYPTTINDEIIIMMQEAKITSQNSVVIPIFILKALARIAQFARIHDEIDQLKGVSVRMSVHSLEILIGESERIRSIKSEKITVPRFCDFYVIQQTSKFELSDMEDTYENRNNILNSIIEESIKQTALEYISEISQDDILKIKSEFQNNKKFIISQSLPGKDESKEISYETQLNKYPTLFAAVKKISNTIQKEEEELLSKIEAMKIEIKNKFFSDKNDYEFIASVTELILEGLRSRNEPIIEKKGIYSYESL